MHLVELSYPTWEGCERDCFRFTGTRTGKTVVFVVHRVTLEALDELGDGDFDPDVALKKHCLLMWSAARKYVVLLNDGSAFSLTLEMLQSAQ